MFSTTHAKNYKKNVFKFAKDISKISYVDSVSHLSNTTATSVPVKLKNKD